MNPSPIWERGKRVHGYWCGNNRVGWVGVPLRGRVPIDGYSWELDIPMAGQKGNEKSLGRAKRRVEDAFLAYLAGGGTVKTHNNPYKD